MADVKPIPDRFHSVTPYLIVPNSVAAIEFYTKAFGAVLVCRMPGPDGESTMHAEISIGDSMLMLTDENPQWNMKSPLTLGGCTTSLHLYVEDADAVFSQAVAAGCQVLAPLADLFWGDRFGKLADPFGHQWSIATHIEDVSPEDMAERAKAAFADMECGGEADAC